MKRPTATADHCDRVIQVLVVYQERLSRETLARVLDARDELHVVGAASDPSAALAMVKDLNPDVALVCMRMQGSELLVNAVFESETITKVVALGESARASHCALWDPTIEDVIASIHAVIHGESLAETATSEPLDLMVQNFGLTDKQQEVVRLIDQGLCNKDIARELNMAVSTVKNHVHSILEKLHVRRRGEAAALVRGAPVRSPLRRELAGTA